MLTLPFDFDRTLMARARLYLTAFAFALVFAMPHPDLWRRQIFAGLLFASFIWCAGMFTAGMRLPAIVLFYFLWNPITIFGFYPQLSDWSIQASAQNFAMLLCVSLIAGLPGPKQVAMFFDTLAGIALAASLWLIAMRFTTPRPYAFMNNPSADASMLAVLYPILMLRDNWFGRTGRILGEIRPSFGKAYIVTGSVLPLIAIACCSSSTGVVALAIALVVGLYRLGEFRTRAGRITAACALAIPLASIPFFTKDHFLNDNGRHEAWRLMLGWWWNYVPTHFTGNGGGTYFYTGIGVQKMFGYASGSIFGFLHNEYLQVLFEQGYIGLALFLLLGAWVLKKSFDRPWLFASSLTYGFIMLTQYPLRFFASAVIGALLVREAYETRKT